MSEVPGRGSARNHSGARRKLRKKLETLGYPPEEVRRLVEEKRAKQQRQPVPQEQPKAERPSWWSKNYPRRRSLALRDGERCYWCKAPLDIRIKSGKAPSPPRATLDHVIPRSLGGPDTLANLVLSCEPCNAERGGRRVTLQSLTAENARLRADLAEAIRAMREIRPYWRTATIDHFLAEFDRRSMNQ